MDRNRHMATRTTYPVDNVIEVTEPLPPAGLAALKRLEQALKAVNV